MKRGGSVLALSFLLAYGTAQAQTAELALLAQLTFLEPGSTLAELSEFIGAPYHRYDADRVLSYPAFAQNGTLYTTQPEGISTGYQLMLEFSDDWRLKRASLVPRAFYFTKPMDLD